MQALTMGKKICLSQLLGAASLVLLLGGCGIDFTLTLTSGNSTIPDPTVPPVEVPTYTGLYDIVDTNQASCYNSSSGEIESCSGRGHDADYNGNLPSYTISSDGLTVFDNVTGLLWTRSSDIDGSGTIDYGDKRYQSEAAGYCAGLTLGGYSWRLPSIKEAYSLILFSGRDASSYTGGDTSTLTPFISSSFDWAFGDIFTLDGIAAGERLIDGQYATSTLYASTTMNGDATMFGVNFVDGRIKGYPLLLKKFYVRCVTGNSSYGINSFRDNGDGTVSDSATGLMWQQDDSPSADWDDALASCSNATTATYFDWRLPNAKELQSIVDYTRSPDSDGSAAIDTTFFNATPITNEAGVTDWAYYWSSTTHVDYYGDGSNAAYLSFGRALGYFNFSVLDVHGAGAQRSNDKLDVTTEPGADAADVGFGLFYFKGPQGDILRHANRERCVRTM